MITTFTTPTKIEYEMQKDEETGLIKFNPTAGGAIPNPLQGWFTGQRYATSAWDSYLTTFEGKPDMRLKDNKVKDEVREN